MKNDDIFPIEKSNLFIQHKLEEEEINKLKWIESEKAGKDIGIYHARWIWITTHRVKWLKSMRESGNFNCY